MYDIGYFTYIVDFVLYIACYIYYVTYLYITYYVIYMKLIYSHVHIQFTIYDMYYMHYKFKITYATCSICTIIYNILSHKWYIFSY